MIILKQELNNTVYNTNSMHHRKTIRHNGHKNIIQKFKKSESQTNHFRDQNIDE